MEERLAAKIVAANKAIIEEGDLDAVELFFTPDHVTHLTEKEMKGGHAAIRKYVKMFRRAFPDISVEVEIFLEGDDRVTWQRTIRATHKNNFMGFSGTGKSIVWREMFTSRFEDGRIAEEWAISDLAERLLLARK